MYQLTDEMKQLTNKIINVAIDVHENLGGPGLYEKIYHEAMIRELELRNISYKTQVPADVIYKGYKLRYTMYVDLVIEDKLILELKATEICLPVHVAQLLNYLRLLNLNVGLLLNFGQEKLKHGLRRVINSRT